MESVFFQKYACLCPGTTALQVSLRSGIFKPRENIEMNFDLNKVFKHLQLITITLVLDLKVFSLQDSK